MTSSSVPLGVPLGGRPPEVLSFVELDRRLRAVLSWLATLGLVPDPRSRLRRYAETVARLAAAEGTVGFTAAWRTVGHDEALNIFFEVGEWFDIHAAFVAATGPGLTRRLGQYLGGPHSYRDERPGGRSATPRNIGFELFVAARLKAIGLEPELDSSGDLSFRLEGVWFPVECKRPYSNIGAEINEARSQIRKRLRATKLEARGLIAVSLSSCLNREFQRLQAQNWPSLERALLQKVSAVVREQEPRWDAGDRRIIGLLTDFRVPAQVDTGLLLSAGTWGLATRAGASSFDRALADKLRARLGPAYDLSRF